MLFRVRLLAVLTTMATGITSVEAGPTPTPSPVEPRVCCNLTGGGCRPPESFGAIEPWHTCLLIGEPYPAPPYACNQQTGRCEAAPATATPSETGTTTAITTSTATPTQTPTVLADPTPSPAFCLGSCGGDHSVTVADILLLVNIALGATDASACAQGIPSSSTVDIALILRAVNNALAGCP